MMKRIGQRQPAFLGHVTRRHGLEICWWLEGYRERERSGARDGSTHLDSLRTSRKVTKDNVSPNTAHGLQKIESSGITMITW